MHKHLDPIRNSNNKTKLYFLMYVLLMHNFAFELDKLHQLKLEEKLYPKILKLQKMKKSDFRSFLFDLGKSKTKNLIVHYEIH